MRFAYGRALRYSRAWARGPAPLVEEEIPVHSDGRVVPGTLYRPRSAPGPLPGWVVLHGLTRPGRYHPSLVRFCRALSSSPAVVLCPEIPEWIELRLAPEQALPVIRHAVLTLSRRPESHPRRTGLIGFSFGAPQALLAATDPTLTEVLACVAGFGGFFDIERTLRFLFTGDHEWQGRQLHRRPDPYGRWIVGANYLTHLEQHRDAGPVAAALHSLAVAAGERRIESWDPAHDPLKAELRASLPTTQRPLWDLFVPPAGGDPTPEQAEPLVREMAAVIRSLSPAMAPDEFVGRLRTPVRLIHGRSDHLIPYTETLRAGAALRGHPDARITITGLFGHSEEGDGAGMRAWEGLRLLRALAGILGAA
ncbi:MAG: hypothetical protein R3E10_05930 [Gemmatimonadota bacterium]